MNEKVKVIAVVGSLRFKDEMMKLTEEMELKGNCMLSVIYETRQNRESYTEGEWLLFEKMHRQRINMADAIFVVNINGYIGKSTRSEIEYAKSLGKEIIYLEE